MRLITGKILAVVFLIPLLPFAGVGIGAHAIASWIDGWEWPHRLVDASERVHEWGQRRAG